MAQELRKGPSGPDADLTSSDIANASEVPGATVTEALDELAGGGGVGTLATFWVDPNTAVPSDDQDGSQSAPFDSVADGFTAMAAAAAASDSVIRGALLLADGVYSDEAISWSASEQPNLVSVALVGLGQPVLTGQWSIDGDGAEETLTFHLYNLGNDAAAGVEIPSAAECEIFASNCWIGAVSGGTDDNVTLSIFGGALLDDITVEDFRAKSATIGSVTASSNSSRGLPRVIINQCSLNGNVTGDTIQIRNCTFDSIGGTLTGTCEIDRQSYQNALRTPGVATTFSSVNLTDVPFSAQQTAYTPAGGSSNVLTVAPAGVPGVYLVGAAAVVTTAAGASGAIAPTFSFTAPTLGATSVSGEFTTILATGALEFPPFTIVSDGSAPITCQFAANAIDGSPVVALYGMAQLVALIPAS